MDKFIPILVGHTFERGDITGSWYSHLKFWKQTKEDKEGEEHLLFEHYEQIDHCDFVTTYSQDGYVILNPDTTGVVVVVPDHSIKINQTTFYHAEETDEASTELPEDEGGGAGEGGGELAAEGTGETAE